MLSNFLAFLKEKNQLNKNTYYFHFNLIEPKEINFIPGQYLILKIDKKTRLYSIASSANQKNSFDLLIKIIPQGLASNYFLNLNINDKVNFLGPAGVFKLKENSNKKIFLSVSTGIAPFLSMIKSKNYNFENDYFLFWGLKYKEDVYFLEKLKEIKNNSNGKFNFKICLSQEKEIFNEDFICGRVDIGLEKNIQIKNLSFFEYYLCGGGNFIDDMKKYLEKNCVSKEKIFFEKYY